MPLPLLLVFAHLAANVVWIGSILGVVVVLTSGTADAATRGKLGTEIYKKLSTPAFAVAFVAGVTRLVLTTDYYFSATHFMHAKLVFALLVIGAHHAVGARAKKMANGAESSAGPAGRVGVVLLLSAVCAAFLAILKPF